ncbi:MAG: hypothetical protein RI885_119 [Actinomycetota bacterium]|jgi:serine/threonine-protein kinase
MIGRLVDGRYQVRSRIARGGMATVYLATDLRLERRVAIKVMHGHLADDSQYKARFIQEARSAARLAHPNVVNVYDQGQDADTAYLVMEYLPGITLRDLLQEHRVLTTEQAFDIMEAVLSGLAAAHKNGIVHRDLKPENVLLADDGRIKIGDFGLARAASKNTATGNALLGTIAYLSPELVTRGIADTRSDIYAVGIMLYEMLAGEQPFKGEQPFQIAHQHANDTVGTPSSKNPAVPTELDELVLWATARDPDQRPRDAKTMLEQLLDTQTALQSGAPTAATAVQRTMVMPPAPRVDTGATQVLTPQRRQRTGPVVADSTAELTRRAGRRRSKGFWLLALVVLLAAAAGGTGWWFGSGPGALVAVPDVANSSVEDARAELTAADLVVAADPALRFDPVVETGLVIGTEPGSGERLAPGETVTLVVSQGPEQLPVPLLATLSQDAATTAITDARFTLGGVSRQFDAEVPRDVVIRALGQDGAELAEGATYSDRRPISLVVSLGAVPDVAGATVDAATAALTEAGLQVAPEVSTTFDDNVPEGSVIQATTDADPIVEGSVFRLLVSDGVDLVAIPEGVEDLTIGAAREALIAVGFVVEVDTDIPVAFWNLDLPATRVDSVTPGEGESAKRGSTVTIEAFS